jgi:hypothetical protein
MNQLVEKQLEPVIIKIAEVMKILDEAGYHLTLQRRVACGNVTSPFQAISGL